MFKDHGTWRSPVAHLYGVQGVVGSNPAVPTAERWGSAQVGVMSNSVELPAGFTERAARSKSPPSRVGFKHVFRAIMWQFSDAPEDLC